MPLSDSSATYMRAVWPLAFARRSAMDCRRLRGLPVLVHEVSRRALGSSTTQDCPGTRVIAPVHVACRDYKRVGVLIASFRSSIAQPTYTPVYASPCSSRNTVQNSGPSGSLLLPRKALSSSTSCRFIPAHCKGDLNEAATRQTLRVCLGQDWS